MANIPAMQKICITKPCMVGGKPAKVGSEPTVPQDEANQLIGSQRAKPVAEAAKSATPAADGTESKSGQAAK